MTISSFDPLSTLDRMLSRMQTGFPAGMSGQMSPPMDVYRRGDEFVVELDVPGVDPSSMDITVERNMLTVAGEIHARHDQDADELLVCERPHARFRRQVYLGESLDTEQISANYEQGVLRIGIPLARNQQSRRIEVQGGSQSGGSGGGSIDVESREQQSRSRGDEATEDMSSRSEGGSTSPS